MPSDLNAASLATLRKEPFYHRAQRSHVSFRRAACGRLGVFLALIFFAAAGARAQVSASITGHVEDPSGAAVVGATVTARNVDTGATRDAIADGEGRYLVAALPVGNYEVDASKQGFKEEVRSGIHLVVGEEATVDLTLQLGEVSQEVTVNGDAPMVSVTTNDISGLVGEQQVKDLPLNGRSFDLLMPLNPGVVNFTSEKAGGTGISNSTNGNNFAVSGNRPQQNLFLLNGVEYTGAAENNMTPAGTSGELLGVDAVREFNVLRDTYGAEYGKHPGAQVLIVTQSGSNDWHGSAYEFLRNNDLDSRNFFDVGASPPGFQRNQFGASTGGPIQKDKTFVFANYEGLRQNLHQTSKTFVPDTDARSDEQPEFPLFGSACPAADQAACAAAVTQLLNVWPAPTAANCPGPELTLPNGSPSGIIGCVFSPLQTIREDFGTTRVDHVFSRHDTLTGVYTIDDSGAVTATPADPYSTDIADLREQVLSLAETHQFSPTLLNTATFGYSRAAYFFLGEPTPGTPAAGLTGFVGSLPVGAVVVGGSTASNPATQLGLAGSNNGTNLDVFRNIFTYEDQATLNRGKHQFTFGAWFQQFQSNERLALSQYGQVTFASVSALLGGTGTLTYDPAPTNMNWRSLFAAWYAADTIRLTPRLTVTLGFRAESSTGWNEAHGRAANYFFTDGVIDSTPHIGTSSFSTNNEAFLPEPRIGLAWSPFGEKTVLRAGFGMYNDLQDALGYRMDQNAPFNPTYSASVPLSGLPVSVSTPPTGAKLLPGGVQPNLKPPTLISYSLRLEHQLTPNTAITLGYVGSHGYHEVVGLDANEPAPVICPASPCPATYPTLYTAAGGTVTGVPVPAGAYYVPAACSAAVTSCNSTVGPTWTWFGVGDSSYNALELDVNHRFSKGLSVRGAYTWSRALDDGDSLNSTTANNAPGLVSNPYDLGADWGPATYNATNVAVINAVYDLPFGHGQMFASDVTGWTDKLVTGWSINSIITAQSGFPFTPQLSYNPTKNGDTKNPVRPFVNPGFSGPVILGNPGEWFNPNAFLTEPNNSGFYGNLGRDTLRGPGLATWDFSVLKDTPIHERLNLQFRAEIFNILDRANFNTPNVILATLSGTTPVANPAAGVVTSTSTSSRQIQFGLKLLW
ncbi:MAG TPA: TonB-dependent receptor [Candidatus Baltobacteraceae bacterium]|nr:TonB-dependent receptor [Candidatus Baltobacteraceae bacterium]